MSWRDNLRKASFRGVEFLYEDVQADGIGRRVKRHEYPGGDLPYHEDLGANTETIKITAYVLEPDHIGRASRLRDVLNAAGAGTLVHPYYGEISAVALPANETFSTREGGMARFSLSFERAGPNRNPLSRTDTASLLETRAATINSTAGSIFAQNFSVDGAPGWIDDSAQDDLGTVLDSADLTLGDAVNTVGDLADFAFRLGDIRQNAASLVRDPAQLASLISTAMDGITGLWPMLKMASSGFQLGTIAATTPTRLLQSNNRQALVGLLNNILISGAIRSLPAASFETAADAYTARDAFAVEIDRQSLSAADDMVRALSNGLAAVTRHVSATAPSLPRLVRLTPSMTRPALAHAYDLYGDNVPDVLARAEQIVTRNRLRHPGFVPAGDVLEVLSNG